MFKNTDGATSPESSQIKRISRKTGLRRTALALGLVISLSTPISAQQVGSEDYTFEANILVTGNDVTSCPYRFVEAITIGVTEDYGADTRGKIYGKLRAKAIKIGADAVVLVTKGKTHMTAWAWNRREYTGRAIRYVDRGCAPSSV